MIHAAAVKNPKMLGGPFMDYATNRVEDVRKLKERTLVKQAKMLELADALQALNKMLQQNAKGYCIEGLYEQVPDILRGYVELTYDLNNHPQFRFFETLLYRSEFYNDESQSIAFYPIETDDRPFVLSTPRLEDDGVLHLKIPFSSEKIDALFRMQREPNDYGYIRDLMGITPEQEPLFRSFFTTEPPQPYEPYRGEGVRTRYFGHACILLESRDLCILSDPVISYGYDSEVKRYTYTDLPDMIDYVVITHNHQDHILLETMLQLRHRIRNIIVPKSSGGSLQDPNLKLMFNNIGFHNVIEIGEMESIDLPGCKIKGLPFLGEHSDLDIRTKLCHLVEMNGLRVLFAADSCNVEPRLYQHIHKWVGDIDILYLGMECDGAPLSWLYGPLLPEALPRDLDHSRRLAGSNYPRGIQLVDIFNPKEVYVYAMGQEPWLNYIMTIKYTPESNPIIASDTLLAECKGRGLVAERLFGEKLSVYDLVLS